MRTITAAHVLVSIAASLAGLATLGLWARYGEMIFSDIVLAALGGCFF